MAQSFRIEDAKNGKIITIFNGTKKGDVYVWTRDGSEPLAGILEAAMAPGKKTRKPRAKSVAKTSNEKRSIAMKKKWAEKKKAEATA